MSEALYDSYEREQHVTRARIMHELNHEPKRDICRVDMTTAREGSTSSWIAERLGQSPELSEWTDDIFDAFRVDKAAWTDRLLSTTVLDNPNTSELADLNRQGLGEFLRVKTYSALEDGIAHARREGNQVSVSVALNDELHAEFFGDAQIWGDIEQPDYELNYWAIIRRIS
jgi:hypothetical protein